MSTKCLTESGIILWHTFSTRVILPQKGQKLILLGMKKSYSFFNVKNRYAYNV